MAKNRSSYWIGICSSHERSGSDGSDPQNPERPDIVEELGPMFEASSFVQLDEHFDNRFVRALFGHV